MGAADDRGAAASPLPAAGREGKDAALVQAMFDRVAPRYDLANTIVSLGQDAGWRRVAARAAQPVGSLVLDAAAGTGVLARELLEQGASGVVAVDLSLRMLAAGHVDRVARVNADALRLPFPDAIFDAVTIGFGLRNLVDPDAGLREFARVTRPGGRLVILEFSQPTWAPFRRMYRDYLVRVLPRVAGAVSP
ncbi:MAG TPA: ubiquinone/menaquinone biosynthesis methyltransferase, partial [Solirubrobacteraceae bacterium]|nr:ubiquinone/menaquinone biosynthesis methyltransferase [Solirubrobacteraceae bacterium]